MKECSKFSVKFNMKKITMARLARGEDGTDQMVARNNLPMHNNFK